MNILELAKRNQQKAWEIIEDTRIVRIWEGIGAKVNLVGSLRTGLLMKHRDIDFHIYTSPLDLSASFRALSLIHISEPTRLRRIDFHIYTSPLDLSASFRAMAELAENTSVKKIEYTNLLHTAEACIEWHAWYQDMEGELWQMDMIHIQEGSRYDGYFERVAERISAVLTDEMRLAILKLKYETPDTEKIMGVEYYQAVIQDGVRSYPEFEEWRRLHPAVGVVEWMP